MKLVTIINGLVIALNEFRSHLLHVHLCMWTVFFFFFKLLVNFHTCAYTLKIPRQGSQ